MVHSFILASIGGLLASFATSFHLFLKGRVTGFSGILYSIWSREEGSNTFRWSIVLGLITMGSLMKTLSPHGDDFFESNEKLGKNFPITSIIISGIMIGFGTKLGNGCTSGHGVCGLPRFSLRSYVAVGIFLSFGIATATLKYHKPFLSGNNYLSDLGTQYYEEGEFKYNDYHWITLVSLIVIYITKILYLFIVEFPNKKSREFSDSIIGYITGLIFGLSLCLSGMTKRSRIVDFLAIGNDWDATLLFILGVSVLLNMITFYFIIGMERIPPFGDKKINIKPSSDIDHKLILGNIFFGIGWGLSGFCPGPVLVNLTVHFPLMFPLLLYIMIGQAFGSFYIKIYELVKAKNSENKDRIKENIIPVQKNSKANQKEYNQAKNNSHQSDMANLRLDSKDVLNNLNEVKNESKVENPFTLEHKSKIKINSGSNDLNSENKNIKNLKEDELTTVVHVNMHKEEENNGDIIQLSENKDNN